jgi:hypothetical protein
MTNLQVRFRSDLGMLFYLTKYSCPDVCNAVRELSKCMDGASMGNLTGVVESSSLCLIPKFLPHNLPENQ